MKKLIIATLACSSVDSLNPIGITQQFILQGLVKKPKHIWYFILTTGVVNMIFGYLVYYGVMTLINNKLDYLLDNYGIILYSLEIFLGLVILFLGIKHTYKNIKLKQNSNYQEMIDNKEEEEIKSKIRSVSPLALIGIGIASTVSELTSAVPYFTFLAVLINYKLSFLIITSILIVYNIIYKTTKGMKNV